MIYHVVAVAENGVIGRDNKLPWHFSSDLKFFKGLTTGHTVIMGRKTYDSIGKELPNRANFILTRNKTAQTLYLAGGEEQLKKISLFDSIDEAIQAVKTPDAFIIGGAEIFRETMSRIDGIYLTRIHRQYEGDTFYPGVPEGFREVSRTPLQEDPKIEVLLYRRA